MASPGQADKMASLLPLMFVSQIAPIAMAARRPKFGRDDGQDEGRC